jgi:uncharacterized membrane protein
MLEVSSLLSPQVGEPSDGVQHRWMAENDAEHVASGTRRGRPLWSKDGIQLLDPFFTKDRQQGPLDFGVYDCGKEADMSICIIKKQQNHSLVRSPLLVAVMALFFVGSASAQIPCSYTVSHIIQGPWCGQFWGYPQTVGTAISPNGRYVVGFWELCGSGFYRAFVYDTQLSAFITLPWPGPGWHSMMAADCNDSGTIVGDGWDSTVYGGQRGWIYNINAPGQYTILEPLPGGAYCAATGINASNVVCGWRSVGPGTQPNTAFSFSLQNGILTDLRLLDGASTAATDINDLNHMTVITGVGLRGFLWHDGRLTEIQTRDGPWVSVHTLNNHDEILGTISAPSPDPPFQTSVGFQWSKGVISVFEPLAGWTGANPAAINDNHVVVGASRKAHPSGAGSVYTPTLWRTFQPVDVASLVSFDDAMWLESITAIDDDERLVAVGIHLPNNEFAIGTFVLAPVFAQLGDVTCDESVNIDDLLAVINSWGSCQACPPDLNVDGFVNIDDLLILINEWSTTERGDAV